MGKNTNSNSQAAPGISTVLSGAYAQHAVFMARALELARAGLGWCAPNPPVGAVLVRDGTIVGEGFHERAGGPHAEIEAIAAAGKASDGATLFVTLEPCNHQGRTPPCCDAVIRAGISEVVVGTVDPNPNVAGGGISRLRAAGIGVTSGVLEEEARELIRTFSFHSQTQRPYVFVKYGASLDGKVATRSGQSKWITGATSRNRVHELRHEVDALLVGVNTVIADDPMLNARRPGASVNPRPVVLDSSGRIPPGATLIKHAQDNNLIVATTDAMSAATEASLTSAGCAVWRLPSTDAGRVDLSALLKRLGENELQSLLVEGGATTLGSFFDSGFVHEIWAFVAPTIIGGLEAPSVVGGSGVETLEKAHRFERRSIELLDNDILIRLTACSQE